MKFTVLSLFPDLVDSFFQYSIMEKAVKQEKITKELVNIRDFAYDKHKNCDDVPYGGGAGMLLKAEPIALALQSIGIAPSQKQERRAVIFPTPSGKRYTQKEAYHLAQDYDELVFICGRYEGIDQRIIDLYVDYEYCIGDYILSSGEVATLTMIDSIYRLCDEVITKESLEEESFSDGLLEFPQYTRPAEFAGQGVPPVLLSGHHAEIDKWRKQQKKDKTQQMRPDLWQQHLNSI